MRKDFFMLAFMLATALISTTAFAYSIAHPQDGIYSIQPKCAPGKELSVQNHDRNWGANVIIDNINSDWQKWKIQRIAGTDFYSIIAVHSGLAVDVANATAQNGINIATWPYLGGSQNQFRIWDAGNNYFVIQGNLNGNDSFVLDVVNAENRAGANVWSYGFNGSDAQLWRLEMTQSLPAFQPYNKTASRKVTAYVMPDLQATAGNEYVSAGDNVTVLREEGNAIFVRYPIRNGTKERWVNKNEIFGDNSSDFDWPIPGNYKYSFRNNHSCRHYYEPGHVASAIDISCVIGTAIYAPAGGVVQNKGVAGGFGNWFEIKHDDGTITLYAHLSDYSMVWNGKRVNKGELIAKSGNTGKSTGPHLHFEMYKVGDVNMRPDIYFKSKGVIGNSSY